MQQLTRGIRIKLSAFVVLGLAGTSYVGASYVGINPFQSGYPVTVSLPDAGGLFVNSEVTYRGVPVGEVTDLTPNADGVQVAVEIDADAPPIPADATVHVANRSAIGEQYLDLRGHDLDETLSAGDHLAGGQDALPQDIAEVLRTSRDFAESVPSEALDTVIDEGYLLSRGAGPDLKRLVRTSMDFQEAADRNFFVSASLIRNSAQVLQTQEEAATSIQAYSNDLALLAETVSDSDADLRQLIAVAPATARQVSGLIRDVGQPLGILMGNLVSTATIFATNSAGVEDAMIRLPEAISIGWSINTSHGLNLGLAPTFFDPLPCVQGYGGTPLRRGTDTSAGSPFNTDAHCTQSLSAGNVRGPQNLARPVGAAPPGPGRSDPDALEAPSVVIDVVDGIDDLMGGTDE